MPFHKDCCCAGRNPAGEYDINQGDYTCAGPLLAYFFRDAFLANALPHVGYGISGHAFQSPFPTPSVEGMLAALVNKENETDRLDQQRR